MNKVVSVVIIFKHLSVIFVLDLMVLLVSLKIVLLKLGSGTVPASYVT